MNQDGKLTDKSCVPDKQSVPGSPAWQRPVALVIWSGTVLLGLIIPLKILGMGYLPYDDALRHVAKVLSGKSWPEIVLMGEGFGGDQHPGWHALLGAVHGALGWGAEALLAFSIGGLFWLFWLALLWRRKRPEVVMLVLFVVCLLAGPTINRLLLGRPFILVMAGLVTILQLWGDELTTGWRRGGVTVLVVGGAVWMNGASWYLFILVIAAFALGAEWRKSLRLAGCWLAGVVLGSILAGRPIGYPVEALRHAVHSFDGPLLQRMLVSEFQHSSGDLALVVVVAMVLMWRAARGQRIWPAVANPLFILALLGWLLGLQVSRFWTDWGFPAALLWLIRELEDVMESLRLRQPVLVPVLAILAAAGVYFASTHDTAGRWSTSVRVKFLSPETPGIAGWLPEEGGLFYTADMVAFYRTFYKNPKAHWRYVLGYEPGIMPRDDLVILRHIQWSNYADAAYEPWVRKLRPPDRLIIMTGPDKRPTLDGLEWRYAMHNTWVGRLPRLP